MKQEPLVTVIVPVYNVAPYLREALDSLIDQTYRNLEILLMGRRKFCLTPGTPTRIVRGETRDDEHASVH